MDTINETLLILTEITNEINNIEIDNYLVYAFFLMSILLIIFLIRIIIDNINRG